MSRTARVQGNCTQERAHFARDALGKAVSKQMPPDKHSCIIDLKDKGRGFEIEGKDTVAAFQDLVVRSADMHATVDARRGKSRRLQATDSAALSALRAGSGAQWALPRRALRQAGGGSGSGGGSSSSGNGSSSSGGGSSDSDSGGSGSGSASGSGGSGGSESSSSSTGSSSGGGSTGGSGDDSSSGGSSGSGGSDGGRESSSSSSSSSSGGNGSSSGGSSSGSDSSSTSSGSSGGSSGGSGGSSNSTTPSTREQTDGNGGLGLRRATRGRGGGGSRNSNSGPDTSEEPDDDGNYPQHASDLTLPEQEEARRKHDETLGGGAFFVWGGARMYAWRVYIVDGAAPNGAGIAVVGQASALLMEEGAVARNEAEEAGGAPRSCAHHWITLAHHANEGHAVWRASRQRIDAFAQNFCWQGAHLCSATFRQLTC